MPKIRNIIFYILFLGCSKYQEIEVIKTSRTQNHKGYSIATIEYDDEWESNLADSTSYDCNICFKPGSLLENPDKLITMTDSSTHESVTIHCGYMQYSMRSHAPTDDRCLNYQTWASSEQHGQCDCSLGKWESRVVDPNLPCDLCAFRELSYVPDTKADELVQTGVAGRMPCGGLYDALANRVLSNEHCPVVQQNAGQFCCSLPSESESVGQPEPQEELEQCKTIHESCDQENPCCTGYECKQRPGIPNMVCSSTPTNGREKIGSSRGGAAGRSRDK